MNIKQEFHNILDENPKDWDTRKILTDYYLDLQDRLLPNVWRQCVSWKAKGQRMLIEYEVCPIPRKLY